MTAGNAEFNFEEEFSRVLPTRRPEPPTRHERFKVAGHELTGGYNNGAGVMILTCGDCGAAVVQTLVATRLHVEWHDAHG